MFIPDMYWQKNGLIYAPQNETSWWRSHGMAPAAYMYDKHTIRIFQGCWDEHGISRIGYVDVSAVNPSQVLGKSIKPVLDIGNSGCFDDNGVFPGHVYVHQEKVYLYYTGFQKLQKIPFSNFSGLAISADGGNNFHRISQAPVMDRTDEGLFTRAGISVIVKDNIFRACYSVGSDWAHVAGKDRPVYEVNYIESINGIDFEKKGRCIVPCNRAVEHGLGRPQIIIIEGLYYVFYTRRLYDYKYHMGVARSSDLMEWERIDDWLSSITYGLPGEFDSEMVYFPCVVDTGKKIYLFDSGNNYGGDGFGFARLIK